MIKIKKRIQSFVKKLSRHLFSNKPMFGCNINGFGFDFYRFGLLLTSTSLTLYSSACHLPIRTILKTNLCDKKRPIGQDVAAGLVH